MKTIKLIALLVLFLGLLISVPSCTVMAGPGNGHRKGWNKNTNNPHHPNSTNPGKGHKKHKK